MVKQEPVSAEGWTDPRFQQRVGQITASNFKTATCTNPTIPSQSLIKRICYPQACTSCTESTRYYLSFPICLGGCCHQKAAITAYSVARSAEHTNFRVKDAGLFIRMERPSIGATPDGAISFDCCGKGILEVKYPHCFKDRLPDDEKENFCMIKNTSGE